MRGSCVVCRIFPPHLRDAHSDARDVRTCVAAVLGLADLDCNGLAAWFAFADGLRSSMIGDPENDGDPSGLKALFAAILLAGAFIGVGYILAKLLP